MARNFVGKVTRHTEQAGVTLRARVTSPQGNVTAYRDFRCMVKPTGLTDEQAVITDLNYITNRLLANGVTGITQNLTSYMPKIGPNETNVTYTVIGENIGEYINSDGIVIKRPTYGETAVVGSLYILVTKNEAKAGREITLSVDPYTITEVKDSITDLINWENIRGQNWPETTDESTSGTSNVIYSLTLPKTVNSNLISAPVQVTWTVTSDALSAQLDEDRIDLTNGEVYRPAFKKMYDVKQNYYTYSNYIIPCTSKIQDNVTKNYMRLGGLVLRASFTIEDTTETVSFNLKTLTLPVTNIEVGTYLESIVNTFIITDSTYNQQFSANSANDGIGSSRIVYIDTNTTNASNLSMFTKNKVVTQTINNDFTAESTGLKIASIQWHVMSPSSMDTSPVVDNSGGLDYSRAGLTSDGGVNADIYMILNPLSMPATTTLILRSVISVSQYEGQATTVPIYYWFNCQDATSTPSTDTGDIDDDAPVA